MCHAVRDKLYLKLMKFSIRHGLLLAGLMVMSYPLACGQDWVSLFNGLNLEGWSVKCFEKDRDKPFWTVEGGMIISQSLGSTDHGYIWLQSEKEFEDFELRLNFSACRDHKGNSGIQVRSRWDPDAEVEKEGRGWLDGPQVDIEVAAPFRNGWIYDETRDVKHWIDPVLPDWKITPEDVEQRKVIHYWADEEPGWNDMRIVCEGTRITTWVNGILIADYDGSGVLDDEAHSKYGVGMKGHIAIQLHKNSENHMRFRDIEIRILD